MKILVKKLFLILAVSFLLHSCVTVKPTGGAYKETQLSPDKGRIIIFRKETSLIGFDTPEINITGPMSLSFFLSNKTFIKEDLVPGKYNIEVAKPTDPGLVWRFDPIKKEILVTKGKSLYFELKTTSVGLIHYVKFSPKVETNSIEKIKNLNRVTTSDKPSF
jgi:hypothetical protein